MSGLMQKLNGRVRRKEDKSMDISSLVSTVKGPFLPNEHHVNTAVYLSIVADHLST